MKSFEYRIAAFLACMMVYSAWSCLKWAWTSKTAQIRQADQWTVESSTSCKYSRLVPPSPPPQPSRKMITKMFCIHLALMLLQICFRVICHSVPKRPTKTFAKIFCASTVVIFHSLSHHVKLPNLFTQVGNHRCGELVHMCCTATLPDNCCLSLRLNWFGG